LGLFAAIHLKTADCGAAPGMIVAARRILDRFFTVPDTLRQRRALAFVPRLSKEDVYIQSTAREDTP